MTVGRGLATKVSSRSTRTARIFNKNDMFTFSDVQRPNSHFKVLKKVV